MDIRDFAIAVLKMNSEEKRKQAISNLQRGLQNESKWDYKHKAEVKVLIQFLESDSRDIEDLEKYRPVS